MHIICCQLEIGEWENDGDTLGWQGGSKSVTLILCWWIYKVVNLFFFENILKSKYENHQNYLTQCYNF